MSYNPYGGNPYGAPPGYGGYGNPPPGMGAPPGLGGPPPGMPHPGMAPPGMHQANQPQSARAPSNFQPPNMPNINFNAPVIRLGTSGQDRGGRGGDGRGDGGRGDGYQQGGPSSGSRPGLGMERGSDNRSNARETVQAIIPPTPDEKLRTLFIYDVPEGFGGDEGVRKLLASVGMLKRWESHDSVMPDRKDRKFGFALFEDIESFDNAVRLLHGEEVFVPVKKQPGSAEPKQDDEFEGIEKVKFQVSLDPSSQASLDKYREGKDEGVAESAVEVARAQLKDVLRDLFYPSLHVAKERDDIAMGNTENGDNVEVVNIPLAQEDELADIPPEIREIVTKEIAAFRERSIQRDMERLRKEEEMEEMERQRSAGARRSRLDVPSSSTTPSGPRGNGVANAPSGPRRQNGGVSFVNGGTESNGISNRRDEDDSDASDEELNRRQLATEKAEAEKLYNEAERKWSNRERSRQAALERERDKDKHDSDMKEQRIEEYQERDKLWDDAREGSKKSHMYYRDHSAWVRKRAIDRADEEARDDADRRAENDERRREEAQMEKARGMADSFLDRQAEEMEQDKAAAPAPAAPQPFKLSLGAAAQKAQASRAAPQRRTIAEVEGLLDDEEAESTTRRQLIPIEYDASTASAGMTEEEISAAVRKLAQEIPSDKDGLWAWDVKWDHMDDSVIRDKLRPFVEKKIMEYLGVQEDMLVEAVEEHLRKHGTASALVEELEGALDDEAEDLVKKLWRMVIFFTESEKRGLPA